MKSKETKNNLINWDLLKLNYNWDVRQEYGYLKEMWVVKWSYKLINVNVLGIDSVS